MKSILKIAAASLALAGLAAVATPAVASPGHVEFRVDSGYYPAPVYAPPRVIYEAPVPVYRYRDDAAWREHEWRERQRREQYWRQQNEWREHQWREHHEWEHRGGFDHGYHGDWR